MPAATDGDAEHVSGVASQQDFAVEDEFDWRGFAQLFGEMVQGADMASRWALDALAKVGTWAVDAPWRLTVRHAGTGQPPTALFEIGHLPS